mmetsp:Transcript_29934/g.69682  ORF Transcript_29934/g.69682 Transcript_29934/m.69682 type:complete len:262 (-) Transcript_29934:1410-2195(-)
MLPFAPSAAPLAPSLQKTAVLLRCVRWLVLVVRDDEQAVGVEGVALGRAPQPRAAHLLSAPLSSAPVEGDALGRALEQRCLPPLGPLGRSRRAGECSTGVVTTPRPGRRRLGDGDGRHPARLSLERVGGVGRRGRGVQKGGVPRTKIGGVPRRPGRPPRRKWRSWILDLVHSGRELVHFGRDVVHFGRCSACLERCLERGGGFAGWEYHMVPGLDGLRNVGRRERLRGRLPCPHQWADSPGLDEDGAARGLHPRWEVVSGR